MAKNDDTVSRIPLGVNINCDPVGENVWGFKKEGEQSVADQQLVSNTGYHFEGGIATLHQNQYTDGNNPVYSYVTEGGNIIELRGAGNDPTSNAPMNGVYLDGKFLDYVPAYGVSSVTAVNGNYDDLILTDANPSTGSSIVGMKITTNSGTSSIVSGSGGTSWSAITGTPAAQSAWTSVAYGNGIWVAVSAGIGTTKSVMRSTNNGISWSIISGTPSPDSGGNGWVSVAYGNSAWIAISGSTGTTGNMMRSLDDGVTWVAVPTTPSAGLNGWICVQYGNGVWIALSQTPSTSGVMRSTDNGQTWNLVTTPVMSNYPRYLSYGNGVWIAVGGASTGQSVMRSTDNGLSWSLVTGVPLAVGGWYCVQYGNGVWIASDASPSSTKGVIRSTNSGATWSSITTPVGSWRSIFYGNGVWVAVAYSTSTTQAVMRSTDDGQTWSYVTGTPASANAWDSVSYGNGAWIAVDSSASTTQAVMRSVVSTTGSGSFSIRLDELSSSGSVTATRNILITGGGYARPIALVKQALGNSFTINSTQYFLAADAEVATGTYNIFSDAGVAQIAGTKIPATWAAGSPKNIWAAKMSATEYWVMSLGTSGASVPSGTITTAGTWTAYKYSWAVMQCKNGKHRIFLTGNNNDATTTGQLMAFSGYKDFSAYTLAPTANTVDTNADYPNQVSASSYGYVDVVHGTTFQRSYSTYNTPTTANYASGVVPLSTATPSSGPVMGFGRLSFVSTADYGSTPPFEFRLGMFKALSSTVAASPQFVSVGSTFGLDGKVAMGTPLSAVGEFDPSWGPQISTDWASVAWRYQNVYYVASISTSPIRPIQKITTNLYKINTISPVNVVSISDKQLILGSNDYNASALYTMSGAATSSTFFSGIQAGWLSNQKTAGATIDTGGNNYFDNTIITSGTLATRLALLGFSSPTTHKSNNYYTGLFYTGSGATATSLVGAYRSDGTAILGSTLNTTFANQIVPASTTYVSNTTALPVPLGSRYAGYTIGTNSSATSLAFNETYITSGFQGTTLTSEWDGYTLGNELFVNSVPFVLFNQPYLFDGKSIYRLSINNGGVSLPITTLIRADGLSFMTTGPQMAFFFSPFDNSVWAFDGGYTLQKLKRLDGLGAIQNGNYSVYESALTVITSTAIVTFRDGLWSSIPRSSSMVSDGLEAVMRVYDTTSGTQFGGTFNWWQYQYYNKTPAGIYTNSPSSGITKTNSVVPFTFQSGYIGPDNNQRMILSAITFAVYNEFKTLTNVKVTVYGYDQDTFSTLQTQTFTIQPSDYINGGIWRGRIQPQTQRWLGASIKIECSTDIRLYDMQYHWTPDVQAIMQGGRTK